MSETLILFRIINKILYEAVPFCILCDDPSGLEQEYWPTASLQRGKELQRVSWIWH